MSNLSLLTGLGSLQSLLTGFDVYYGGNSVEFTVELVPFYSWGKNSNTNIVSHSLSAKALKVRSI